MFKHFSLRLKLTSAFLLVALVIVGLSYYQILSIQHANSLFVNLINEDFKRLDTLQDIELISTKVRDATIDYRRAVTTGNTDEMANLKVIVVSQSQALQTAVDEYQTLTQAGASVETEQQVNSIKNLAETVIERARTIINTTPLPSSTSLTDAEKSLDSAIAVAAASEKTNVTAESNEADKTFTQVTEASIIAAVVAAILAIILGVITSEILSRSLSKLKSAEERVANGDFSRLIVVKSSDEIGQLGSAFNRMAERLRESYRRLAIERQRDEAMLQSMGEGLLAIDAEGKVVLINKVAHEFLGLSGQTDVVGKNAQDVLQLSANTPKAVEPLPAAEQPTVAILASGQPINEVYAFHKANASKVLLSINATPIRVDNAVTGAIIVFRDVTKEKEIDRMKTEFISLASHQLRTPLSAIKWFSEMLLSGDAGKLLPEQTDFAQNIADSTERMVQLVNSLLNISRIESGRIMIVPQPTDLKELVTGIINDLKGKTEAKKQNLIISVHQDLPKVNLDPRLISQVYMNLLTNAIKYTPKGGEISVFISKKDDQIISQVTDNGYGIPKEQQGRVFEKFFRAANAVKVETDGTGLGLYLIKAVIESSGGKIWFESAEGKGTTFWFSIPMSGMKAKEGEVTLDA